jgi:PD-(D/E)XK nuclease superfamily
MIFSATEIMTFLRCRYQWEFSSFNRMGLTPIVGASYFNLGTCVHQSLADWAFRPTESLPLLYQKNALAIRQTIIDDYIKRVGVEPFDSELKRTDKALEDGLYMMMNYQKYYGQPLADGWKPLEVEQTFTIPIPNSDNFLECTQDAIIASANGVAPMEHKTYSIRPNEDMLYRNFQFKCYNWALIKANIAPVLGIAYNGLWVRREPPKGCTMSDLFHREIITFSDAEMEDFETKLTIITNEMANNPTLYEHIPWDGCRCSYKEACNARISHREINLDLHYKKRDKTPAWMTIDD